MGASVAYFVVINNALEASSALDPGPGPLSPQAEALLPTFAERNAFLSELGFKHAKTLLLYKELRSSLSDFRSFAIATGLVFVAFAIAFALLLWHIERLRKLVHN